MLLDPSYAQAYQQVQNGLNTLEAEITDALDTIHEYVKFTQEQLKTMEENAHHLPDGRAVFFSEDGSKAFTEDGEELSDEERDRVIRSDKAVTWKKYQDMQKRALDALNGKERVEEYQDMTRRHRKRIESGDPIPKDELDGMLETIDKAREEVKREKRDAQTSLDAAKEIVTPSGQSTPDSVTPSVSSDIPDFSAKP